MPTCRDVTRIVASDELGRSSWVQRLAVRLHLAMCEHCRRFQRELREIGQAVRRIALEEGPDAARLEALERKVRDARSEPNPDP